jgi:twitching motility protein PilT
MVTMHELFVLMHQRGASDLHLSAFTVPMLRIDGEMVSTPYERLSGESVQTLVFSVLNDAQRQRFDATNELDMAFSVKDTGQRLRMNVFRQRGTVGAVVRAIPNKFRTFEDLGLPAITGDLMKLHKGLILVTGPTGSGKSTTLASMIDYLNTNFAYHIMTIEDPIEYVHANKKSLVNQREVGQDTETFTASLKHVLRQDPDVILIGELRDLDTIQNALTIAETGHLVFGTLHTTDCAQTINRVIDVFPPHQQAQVRVQLSFVLQAVYSQQLVASAGGSGRTVASEVLIVTGAIRNLVREQKIEQIQMMIQTGGKFGMQTMNTSLADLYRRQKITYQEALNSSADQEDLKRNIQQSVGVGAR